MARPGRRTFIAAAAAQTCVVLTGTCLPVNIALSTASLAAGTYTEFIMLTDPNALDSPQQIAVTITVAGVPGSLTFYVGPAGSTNASAFTYIYPASPVTGSVTTQSGGNWLSFIPAGGLIDSPAAIDVGAADLSTGTYMGSVTTSGSTQASDNKTIAVTLNVTTSPVIDLAQISTMALFGAPGSGKTTSYFAFTSAGGALTITGAAGSAAFLSASVYSPAIIAITADPTASRPALIMATSPSRRTPPTMPLFPCRGLYRLGGGESQYSANGIVNPSTYGSSRLRQER